MKSTPLAIIIILVGLFLSRDKLAELIQWESTPTDFFKEVQCKGKKLCGVVYLKPLSKASTDLVPEIQKYLLKAAKHPEYGIQVIVGRGKTSEENRALATLVGGGAIADNDDILGMEYAITDAPGFFVIDSLNETKLAGIPAWGWCKANFGP